MGRRWTVADIPDLRGRTAIVTGASSGIGFQTASALARRGARVILAVRSLDRGSVAADIIRTHHTADVDVWELDLANLASVRSFVTRWCEGGAALDVLINNAGTMALTRRQTADGVEVHFGVNHLGHFALTGLLMPSLSTRGRVVTVSSLAHRVGRIRLDDLAGRQRVSPLAGYAQSKLANLLFTAELDRRLRASGSGVSAMAAHPGFTATHIIGIGPTITAASRRQQMTSRLMSAVVQDAAMGALPVLRAAVDVSIPSGAYVGPRGWLEIRGYPREVLPASRARDSEVAQELWRMSEDLTGVSF